MNAAANVSGFEQGRNLAARASKVEKQQGVKDEQAEQVEQKPTTTIPIWGRTSDGITFAVPKTHDMIHTLLDPRLKKTLIDIITVLVLTSWVVLYFWLSPASRTPVFFILFMAWRLAYNYGIGYILMRQSKEKWLTNWARKNALFSSAKAGEPTWVSSIRKWLQSDLNTRLEGLGQEEIDKIPLEFKIWLVFRHSVDLILMSDFVTYVLLAFSVLHRTSQPWHIAISRVLAGIMLCIFNLWVKVDAHRVVKDFAWYWGDFFFLEDTNLTFDGVFELAPHPMYSIGYAGYYGASLMTSSPLLFVASALAHACQFAFLIFVENPHIEKTYLSSSDPVSPKQSEATLSKQIQSTELETELRRPPRQAMLILSNFSFTRTSDIFLVASVFATSMLYFIPTSTLASLIVFALALGWRLSHTLGLGVLLNRQSDHSQWTKLHLKYGGTPWEAYEQWQAIYNTTLVMSYTSLFVLFLREFHSPFAVNYWFFRFALGLMLLALQAWTSFSIYEELGDYGWFFGDFFYTKGGHTLSFSGIYRYLNHPERLVGLAGIWGLVLVGNSTLLVALAFVYTFTSIAFIQFVEKPHMIKLYGAQILNRKAGVSRNLEMHMKINVGGIDSLLELLWKKYIMVFFDRLELLRPQVSGVVADTRAALNQYPAKVTEVLSDDISGRSIESYSLNSEKDCYQVGEPIVLSWSAPADSSPKDWIGMYRLYENQRKDITGKSSAGRWNAVNPKGYSDHLEGILEYSGSDEASKSGVVKFFGSRLFWAPGAYEFRYHHNGKHNVLARSQVVKISAQKAILSDKSDKELATELATLYTRAYGAEDMVLDPNANLDFSDNKILAMFTEAVLIDYDVDLAPFVISFDSTLITIARRVLYVDSCLRRAPLENS